jgi:hypothetical protein
MGIPVGTTSAKTATNVVLAGKRRNKTPLCIVGVNDVQGFLLQMRGPWIKGLIAQTKTDKRGLYRKMQTKADAPSVTYGLFMRVRVWIFTPSTIRETLCMPAPEKIGDTHAWKIHPVGASNPEHSPSGYYVASFGTSRSGPRQRRAP